MIVLHLLAPASTATETSLYLPVSSAVYIRSAYGSASVIH